MATRQGLLRWWTDQRATPARYDLWRGVASLARERSAVRRRRGADRGQVLVTIAGRDAFDGPDRQATRAAWGNSGSRRRGNLRLASRIGLLEIEPELAGLLSEEQRQAATGFSLPLSTITKDEDIEAVVEESKAFGALILDGLLLQVVQVDGQPALRLIGPGALAPLGHLADSLSLARTRLRVPVTTHLVLLGDRFLIAVHRWPSIVVCLHKRMLEQAARLATQLAVCQLPRVEDRVMGLMRLLAESWGRVTPHGIRVELGLSHETLGELIGARRPTVSLAVEALAERDALIKHGHGWLIVQEHPSTDSDAEPSFPDAYPVDGTDAQSPGGAATSAVPPVSPLDLADIARLRAACEHNRQRADRLKARARSLCAQAQQFAS